MARRSLGDIANRSARRTTEAPSAVRRLWYWVTKVYEGVLSGITWLAMLAVLVLTIITLREVIGRHFFNAPSGWVDEIAGYLVAGTVFLGAAYALRTGQLISITLLVAKLPPPVFRIIAGLGLLVSFIAIVVAIYYVGDYVLHNYQIDRRSNTRLRVRLWMPQSIMFFGLVVLASELLRQAIATLIKPRQRATGTERPWVS
jgi:C4-dicarboxylate transporter, DctQ subunit